MFVVGQFCGVLEETLSSHWILAFAKTPNATCIIARRLPNYFLKLHKKIDSEINLSYNGNEGADFHIRLTVKFIK